MSHFKNDSIFWIELEKIKPNPFQPRREFNHEKLNSLAESIRQYGILQPIVVTRLEKVKDDGGLFVEYELVAGERRLRASKIAGLVQIPVIIRSEEDDDGLKLELAIIENLQREDLNPIDRAKAFDRLIKEFSLKHSDVAKKVGKSRVYVTNTLRLLALPEEMMQAVANGQIMEGHTRPILMLRDKPQEQMTLYKEIIYKKLSVRDTEAIARRIAYDKVRKKDLAIDPELVDFEERLAESLGTRVQIERKEVGGKVIIDFFTNEDVKKIIEILRSKVKRDPNEALENYEKNNPLEEQEVFLPKEEIADTNDEDDEELYSLKEFSL
ncbi:MAG: ParB/RepB/Spo0J family partition protein [Patescibacteria group bacterium]|nr:ParB/RepB/Spo0J family partition protein [Patescibacteria group bacterium]